MGPIVCGRVEDHVGDPLAGEDVFHLEPHFIDIEIGDRFPGERDVGRHVDGSIGGGQEGRGLCRGGQRGVEGEAGGLDGAAGEGQFERVRAVGEVSQVGLVEAVQRETPLVPGFGGAVPEHGLGRQVVPQAAWALEPCGLEPSPLVALQAELEAVVGARGARQLGLASLDEDLRYGSEGIGECAEGSARGGEIGDQEVHPFGRQSLLRVGERQFGGVDGVRRERSRPPGRSGRVEHGVDAGAPHCIVSYIEYHFSDVLARDGVPREGGVGRHAVGPCGRTGQRRRLCGGRERAAGADVLERGRGRHDAFDGEGEFKDVVTGRVGGQVVGVRAGVVECPLLTDGECFHGVDGVPLKVRSLETGRIDQALGGQLEPNLNDVDGGRGIWRVEHAPLNEDLADVVQSPCQQQTRLQGLQSAPGVLVHGRLLRSILSSVAVTISQATSRQENDRRALDRLLRRYTPAQLRLHLRAAAHGCRRSTLDAASTCPRAELNRAERPHVLPGPAELRSRPDCPGARRRKSLQKIELTTRVAVFCPLSKRIFPTRIFQFFPNIGVPQVDTRRHRHSRDVESDIPVLV